MKLSTKHLSGIRKTINGEKILILRPQESKYKPKKKRISSGSIAKIYKNL